MTDLKPLFLIACIILASACLGEEKPATTTSTTTVRTLQQAYLNAIKDAELAEEDEIYRNLVAITENNSNLLWSNGRILAVTWTSWDGYLGREGMSMNASKDVWVTTYPELTDFISNNGVSGAGCPPRIEQLLGIPASNGKKWFVELWVKPKDIFRPSPDPEITDSEAELEFPPNVSEDHMAWFNHLRETSYGGDGYPWTRLGYTYDWGSPDTEIGLSEFVIRTGSEVVVRSVLSTREYCGA